MSYKRNQIEEAISRLFNPESKAVPTDLRTRINRLFELDRSLGRSVRSKDPEQANYAFFSNEAPGTGADISFSEYDAFALVNGLRLMTHGWPQGFAVSTMRRLRRDLEKEHARILKQNPDDLFNQQVIHAKAQPGDIAVGNTDPVFLTIASRETAETGKRQSAAVCRGLAEVYTFGRSFGSSSLTFLEVVTLSHKLHDMLIRTEPRRRGRS